MDKLLQILEEKMTPIAVKLEQNRYLSAVKNSFMSAMPLLIIGSFFILLAYLPIPPYTDFMLNTFGDDWQRMFTIPNNISMSMMTVYVVIGIGNELAQAYGLDRMAGIFAALASFFVVTPMHAFAEEGQGIGIPLGNLGAAGLFVGILIAILSVEIIRFTDRMGWKIKMPDSVPQNVSKSFSSLIPVALVIVFFNFVRIGFEQTSYGDVQTFIFNNLQTPLTALGSTLPATIVVLILEGILWSFGLHGSNIVGSVMQPIWLTLTAENATAVAAGQAIPNIVNYQFYSNFVKVGGSGATFGLCLLLLFAAKSKQLKALGKLSIGPEIFTINESIIFGMPIVLNPIMIVPFLLTPLVLCIVAYFAMSTGLVPLTNGVNIPWTTPPVISGFLVSGWRGAVLNIVQIGLSAAIYFPFFKIVDNIAVKEEAENETEMQHQMDAVEA
ncbi:PTS sugar transporter subunit IIC [Trichococcus ilyis]|jgi:PTS system cellobiose-specific IIC component|uniref:Permease IIC component n=1 Tax=Trichococcus ilyis TaxID=640938 RepID=A0A143YMR9_9LACT|nr:PTS sugar transporter subunit IIC [Trichococcus ilyis]CZQ92716.1 phosphotransferase system eiic [Trichococcus ilyis]SEI94227.1 PTS system, cellobiose-specific IIC component [Trichococcus ilyis]